MLTVLRDDALTSTADGTVVHVSLPWIRSLPVSSLASLTVHLDGDAVPIAAVTLRGRRIDLASDLVHPEPEDWWFVQERLAVRLDATVEAGLHEVAVAFELMIPYLPGGPDRPLTLPFHARRRLPLDATPATAPALQAPASAPAPASTPAPAPAPAAGATSERDEPTRIPPGWTLAASAFNWTPEIVRAERDAIDIVTGVVADGVAAMIELEPGQLWRSFPTPTTDETQGLRTRLADLGGTVSIVGASLDDWLPGPRRRTEEERWAFLVPQLHAAHEVGAAGVRLPIGQAGPALLRRILPLLHELELTLFEEIQGQQDPASDPVSAAIETVAALEDPRVRLLVDTSMLMPALPPSYLQRLEAAGVSAELCDRLAHEWRDPATHEAVIALLRAGGVPPAIHTLFMNLIVRFGRSQARELRPILPLVGAFHLKFWDLDDDEGRVSGPIRDLGAELARTGFAGTLCSEWGGHDWLDDDPTETTRAHLALAARALAAGAAAS